ncbi:MAG: DNA polymerase III subunit gamma/tau [bacterium]|nr:DNA polymerase III subunit gamma/tau [bacterium]
MAKALYRKYRSKKLSEIIGQEHITRTLENALKNGKISHAYLFTGPRGTGKTSIARILAHEINELPYTDESIHLDIIEIDAASNRRIDEIRDLREKVYVAPSLAKYKVYIIDEVHMLTREAFNALLKTLEEPPAHVIFILATTEIHKLPETIISRTQRFTFKPIDEILVVGHLKNIAKKEGIMIEDEALQLLAAHGRGSFRDSISLLDQIGSGKKNITREIAEQLVGVAANDHIIALQSAVLNSTPAAIVDALDDLTADGIGPVQVAKQLALQVRHRIIEGDTSSRLTNLLADLLQVSSSIDPSPQLEINLFRANLAGITEQSVTASMVEHEQPTNETAAEKPKIDSSKKETSTHKPDPNDTKGSPSLTADPNSNFWPEVLKLIKSSNNTLYGVLRMAEASLESNTLHLHFGFLFHQKKAADASTIKKIREAVKSVTGSYYHINVIYDDSLSKTPKSKNTNESKKIAPKKELKDNGDSLTSIKNIFGGGEVLES